MRFWFSLIAAIAIAACASDPPPPEAVLSVSPERGIAPEKVRLDASGSTAGVVVRFDFEGDGTFDTEYSSTLEIEHEYATPGQYPARVEVKDANGELATASKMIDLAMNQPPVAALTVAPESGKAPLIINADASASTDPDQAADTLEARFDFDADGIYETEFSRNKTATHTYFEIGSYVVVVEVKDARGGVATSRSKAIAVTPSADIDVDTNRDGAITAIDEAGEDTFSTNGGAVMLANVDDDDGDRRRDFEDTSISGTEDALDLAPIVLNRYTTLGGMEEVELSVAPEAAYSVRIFNADGSELYRPGAGRVPISASDLANGDLRLFIEATKTRSLEWDGSALITLAVIRGDEREEDTVLIRTSPVIFPDNLQPANTLYVMRIDNVQFGRNLEFFNALTEKIDPEIMIFDVDQYDYWADRWVQDTMQTGYQEMPIAGGVQRMKTYLEAERRTGPEGLEYLVTRNLLGPDFGYVYPGGSETSLNYGGNLEIAPPVANFPLGRTLVGGGNAGLLGGRPYEDHMTPAQRDFLDAQPQGPTIEISTEWLGVGHADEIFQFVPDSSPMAEHPFKVVIASPVLARRTLEELSGAGMGRTVVFDGRRSETTVDEILADEQLMVFNDAAQARVDTVRATLKEGLGLGDADFVEVPVLYEPVDYDGYEFAIAYNPGIQNLVTARNTLFVPDPEGPDRDGADIWQTQTRAVLEPLGVTVEFVDVFESYHENFGEAHCGTEVDHAPYDTAWWEVE
jgi:protein-arginine deiminase